MADQAADVDQHYNEMCYRLLRGDALMRKVLSDSAQGISLLRAYPLIDPERIGMMGHSYGGNLTLFHGALDEHIRFACATGAAGSYAYRLANQVGIEMAEVIPGFAARFDMPDLLTCCAPRRVLIVSATDDPFSQDADRVVAVAQEKCVDLGSVARITHHRYAGEHAVTQERCDDIVRWFVQCVA